jgi:hypothetical protein
VINRKSSCPFRQLPNRTSRSQQCRRRADGSVVGAGERQSEIAIWRCGGLRIIIFFGPTIYPLQTNTPYVFPSGTTTSNLYFFWANGRLGVLAICMRQGRLTIFSNWISMLDHVGQHLWLCAASAACESQLWHYIPKSGTVGQCLNATKLVLSSCDICAVA